MWMTQVRELTTLTPPTAYFEVFQARSSGSELVRESFFLSFPSHTLNNDKTGYWASKNREI